jgi:hypothetical protein
VGGVNLILVPMSSAMLGKAGLLASDGRSKTMDAAADGYGRTWRTSHIAIFTGHMLALKTTTARTSV